MINKQTRLVEILCAVISLNFYFKLILQLLVPQMDFVPPKKISLGGPVTIIALRRSGNLSK